ncbi:MAG: AI-2E family transporter [Verrucomicrobia bacterium]|nr:AI-2E family transporter [Verrucomicrobiota bacterium]
MPRRYPTLYQQRTLWNAATGLSIVLLGTMIVGLVWLSGQIFGYLQPVLVPLAVAGIVAYLLDPAVQWIQRKGLSRLRAVIVTFCGFLIAICLGALIIVPPIIGAVGQLATDFTSSGTKIEDILSNARDNTIIKPAIDWALSPSEDFADEFPNYAPPPVADDTAPDTAPLETPPPTKVPFNKTKVGNWAITHIPSFLSVIPAGTNKILGFLGYLIGFAMVPIYLYYFLKEGSTMKAHWHDYVPLHASRFKDEVVDCVSEINGYLLAFFRGQVVVAFIDGILIGIALFIFQLPYAPVIGLAMAVIGVIPFIGNILCLIPSCIIAYVHFSSSDPNHQWLGDNPWAYVGVVVAIFVVAQQINSLLTAPKIVGDSVGLHPMTVIFSMLFWSIPLGGFLGALLAVPLTAAVKVLFRRYIWEKRIMEAPDPEPAA